MGKYLTILPISVLFSGGACTQGHSEKDVPEAVKTAFLQKFPAAKKVNWGQESADDGKLYFNSIDLLKTMVIKRITDGPDFCYPSVDYYEVQVFQVGFSH